MPWRAWKCKTADDADIADGNASGGLTLTPGPSPKEGEECLGYATADGADEIHLAA
jgi:hypothetical protein